MRGKRKLAAVLRRKGVAVSTSTVGRILRKPMDRGVVIPVPTLRRNPAARRVRLNARERYARRLPKGLKPTRLTVLPPESPQLKCAVERAQGSWCYEFYACFDLPHRIDKLQAHVDAFAHRYNRHGPHQALGDRTPAEYLAAISSGPPASHMS